MTVKRFIPVVIIATIIFLSGVVVGRFILSPPVEIVTIDVEKLALLIEKYNAQAEEIKEEFSTMKEWNKEALTGEEIKSKEKQDGNKQTTRREN